MLNESTNNILIVDDDIASCRTLELHFQTLGHKTATAHSVDEGLEVTQKFIPNLIILDIRMPGKSGLDGILDFKKQYPSVRIIMITAFHDMDSTITAMQRGADEYIHKPIDIDELDGSVSKLLLANNSMEDNIKAGPINAGTRAVMVGRSHAMKEIFKTIGMVASSPATVLITGESGTGKELVAKAIHRASTTPDGPFVAMNCAALVETLLESDMFGHEKGSFSGAIARQPGKFALARGGTIFLDEIGEMSATMQAKLLRVLQEKEFTPVGGKHPETTDARVIAATNVNLHENVANGLFREDLFYRLQVVNIHLPPLRQRKDDIVDLVQTLLARINYEMKRDVTDISMDVIEAFTQYDWPGNVRELENVLMKAVATCANSTITIDMLPPHISKLDVSHSVLQDSCHPDKWKLMSLNDMEKLHVKRILDAYNWHKGKVCDVLGVSRPRLRRMIQHFELHEPTETTLGNCDLEKETITNVD